MKKKSVYLKDIRVGMKVDKEPFVLQEYEVKNSKQGKQYYNVKFGDRTGELRGKVWGENMPNCDKDAKVGDIVSVTGTIQEYAGKPQIIVDSFVVANDFPVEEFLPTTSRNRESMIEFIDNAIRSVKNEYYRKLLLLFWDNPQFKDLYVNYPAAEYVHHGYVGGLLEHVWEMWKLTQPFFELYPMLDKDLLFTGLFFHDVGKIEELEIRGATIVRTKAGRLVAHIGQGLLIVDRLVQSIEDFPIDLRDKLYHLILSHQGELEYGSPVKPQMLEAIVLNMVDMNSANMNQATKHLENDRSTGEFTDYHKWLKRSLLIPEQTLGDQ